LNDMEQNERNEKRQRIIETSEKAARVNQELSKVPKKEEEEQISGGMLEANLLSRGVSGLYCLLVVAIYVTITANRLTSSPMLHPDTEVSVVLLYLYSVSCIFLIIILGWLGRPPFSSIHIRSHGSTFLRQGAVLFGIGSLAYCLLEFVTFFIIDLHPDCTDLLVSANSLLAIILLLLQTVVIVMYPRLKMALAGGLPHLGLMHLVATNLVLWMRTVIRESIHEFHVRLLPAFHVLESDEGNHHGHHGGHSVEADHSLKFKMYNNQIELCMKMYADDDFVTSILKSSSPFLYAFIVEFSLVAVTFFFSTWATVGCISRKEMELALASRRFPDFFGTLQKVDWSHSTIGFVAGIFVMSATVADIVMFFSDATLHSESDVTFEYIGKVLNCVLNCLGILATCLAISQVTRLEIDQSNVDNSLNIFLLLLGIFFVYVYSCLTITVGVFTNNHAIPGGVHIANGVLELIAVTLQIILIFILLSKKIKRGEMGRPGRQAVTFLAFLNFSLWLFDSFELQKSKASMVESYFYGAFVWVWMQRITLPLCIFFRFHSTVMLVDCWKNSYRHLSESVKDCDARAEIEKDESLMSRECGRPCSRAACHPCDIARHYI